MAASRARSAGWAPIARSSTTASLSCSERAAVSRMDRIMQRLGFAILLTACAAIPAVAAERTVYTTGAATCDGWPRAPIGMAPGYCAGIVVAPPAEYDTRTIRQPRVLLALPGGKDFLVTDV